MVSAAGFGAKKPVLRRLICAAPIVMMIRNIHVIYVVKKVQHASPEHVVFALLWETAMHRGALQSLYMDDYDPETRILEIHHRPDTDTPIKNKHKGECLIALTDDFCALLDDWIADQRPDVVDDYGRVPLIARCRDALMDKRSRSMSIWQRIHGYTAGLTPAQMKEFPIHATQHGSIILSASVLVASLLMTCVEER